MNNNDKKHNPKMALAAVFGVLLLLAALAGVTQYIERQQKASARASYEEGSTEDMEEEEEYSIMSLYGQDFIYYDEIETYLFMGTDASGNEDGEGEDYQGSMADFLALLIVNRTDETYSVLQLNRDTMTDMDLILDSGEEVTTQLQICTGHWYGEDKESSCENMVDVVSGLFDQLDIDGYYALPMESIPELNHLVGGVTVQVMDDFSKVDPTLKEGETIRLSDEQAYEYIHDRYDVGDEENTSRMQRQKQYMSAFADQAKQMASEDSGFAAQIYQEFQDVATTDITGKQSSKLINRVFKYENLGIYQFEGETKLGKQLGDDVEHVEFYPDSDSVIQVMTELYGLEPDKEE